MPVIAKTIRRDVQDSDLRDGVLVGGGAGGGGRERGGGEWIASGIYAMEITTSGKSKLSFPSYQSWTLNHLPFFV